MCPSSFRLVGTSCLDSCGYGKLGRRFQPLWVRAKITQHCFGVLFGDWRPTRAQFTFGSILEEVTDAAFVQLSILVVTTSGTVTPALLAWTRTVQPSSQNA